ncbi:MAG: hydrogenase nickel incorporation protein HypB [Spirochaetota bacterium]|nr:hydrogenase nickel incorporation protein HypB [Spirochaetota bacterium]
MEIKILKNIFESNVEMAGSIRDLLIQEKVYMIDIMGSPGSGKTTLTDKIVTSLKDEYRIGIIEGDIKTTKDSEKLTKHKVPIVQIETSLFGGDCHLESSWIKKSLEEFDLSIIDLIIIENIGNLVCPAEFELGDDERIVVLSVTEGEDKPVKYPLMFNTSKTLILNKIDLLPYLDYNLEEVKDNIRRVNPNMNLFQLSATSGEGYNRFIEYLRTNINNKLK